MYGRVQVKVQCDKKEFSLQQWQAEGYDAGTAAHDAANTNQIISWARSLLSF